jgi:alginate O-acetyltransferase complex protein AlgI
MVFSTWQFAFFFIAVLAVYWALPGRRWRHPFLLFASYVFYMAWNAWMVAIILGLTLFDYSVGLLLERIREARRRRLLLVASLAANLGTLAVFKYADFFLLSLRDLLLAFGLRADLNTLGILLPVGISFHTFQTMSYTIDVYRGRCPATRSLPDFALFVAFFPQLVAGPITRAMDFLPQLEGEKRFDLRRFEACLLLFLVGLTKKLLIADQLAGLVDPVFAEPHRFVTRDLWLAMLCYGGQIYGDFSGYSDMAVATAGMLGFHLPDNFANPYLATGLSDFWRRWHISLSTWLRDYLYIPLGGSRGGATRTCRNLMITMLLGGLWHGASWTFVLWGAIHGAALAAAKAFAALCPAARLRPPSAARSILCWAVTFLLVHLAWVFFRCQPMVREGLPEPTSAALERAAGFIARLWIPADVPEPIWLMNKLPMLALVLLGFGLQAGSEWSRRGARWPALPAPLAGAGYAAWIIALVVLSPENTSPFIYFQF